MKKVFFVAFLGFLAGFILLKIVSKDNSDKFVISKSSTSAKHNSINAPVDPNNKDIIFFGLAYTFGGVVKQFEGNGSSYKIALANRVSSMPEFATDNKTTVVRRINGVDSSADFSEIKIGDKMVLAALYDYRKKAWKVTKIFLIQNLK